VHGRVTKSAHSLKQAKAQKEPWLLAVSPQLERFRSDSL
jgi:hypothetical protein